MPACNAWRRTTDVKRAWIVDRWLRDSSLSDVCNLLSICYFRTAIYRYEIILTPYALIENFPFDFVIYTASLAENHMFAPSTFHTVICVTHLS